MTRRTLVAALGLATPAVAQLNRYEVTISNVISPANPSATIQLWAKFDPSLYAYIEGRFDVASAPDLGAFSDPLAILEEGPPGDGEVSPDGDSVIDVHVFQMDFPPNFWPDTSNPILIWQVTWSTSDFTPRHVPFGTETSSYRLDLDNNHKQDFADTAVEASGSILVVPSPAAWPLAMLGIAARRKRR